MRPCARCGQACKRSKQKYCSKTCAGAAGVWSVKSEDMRRKVGQRSTRHGYARVGKKTREYRVWCNIIDRCERPGCKFYPRYGGRGIRICERWRQDFTKFLEDMGPCPDGWSIDRTNNDGHYEPENCRWVSPKEQQRNRADTVRTEVRGETMCLSEIAEKYELKRATVSQRYRNGDRGERLIRQPRGGHNGWA